MGGRRPLCGFSYRGNDNIVDFRFDFCVGSAIGLDVANDIVLSISVDSMNAVASGSISGRRIIRDHGYAGIVVRAFGCVGTGFYSTLEFFQFKLDRVLRICESHAHDQEAYHEGD